MGGRRPSSLPRCTPSRGLTRVQSLLRMGQARHGLGASGCGRGGVPATGGRRRKQLPAWCTALGRFHHSPSRAGSTVAGRDSPSCQPSQGSLQGWGDHNPGSPSPGASVPSSRRDSFLDSWDSAPARPEASSRRGAPHMCSQTLAPESHRGLFVRHKDRRRPHGAQPGLNQESFHSGGTWAAAPAQSGAQGGIRRIKHNLRSQQRRAGPSTGRAGGSAQSQGQDSGAVVQEAGLRERAAGADRTNAPLPPNSPLLRLDRLFCPEPSVLAPSPQEAGGQQVDREVGAGKAGPWEGAGREVHSL